MNVVSWITGLFGYESEQQTENDLWTEYKQCRERWNITKVVEIPDSYISGIAFDNEGFMYCSTQYQILKIYPDAHNEVFFEDDSDYEEFNISDLVFDGTNTLYFINSRNEEVHQLCISNKEHSTLGGRISPHSDDFISGIAVSTDGTLYAIATNTNIYQIKDGITRLVVSSDILQLRRLHNIVVDLEGNLFVTSDGATLSDMVLHKIDLKRKTISDVPLPRSFVDGLAVDKDGNVLVATSSTVFRMIAPWKWERYLWIGYLKESAIDCNLARLPKDIIKCIALFL